MNTDTLTARAIAERFALQLQGDGDTVVRGVATLAHAGPDQLGFLANPHYRHQLAETRAGVVVVRADDAPLVPGTALVARDPYSAFARIAALFDVAPARPPGIHPSAVIHPQARVAASAHVGPNVVVGARSTIGEGVFLGPGCTIGEDCSVGDGCELIARVSLVVRVHLGARVRIHPGAVLGADGFGLAMQDGHWIKVPQLGGVRVGDDCEIGANSCIDRGALEDTVLEEDVRLDNLVQVAHNCHVGAHTAMAGQVGVAGSTRIGRYCMFGGQVGIAGHLEICDRVVVLGKSLVGGSIREPGEYSASLPAVESRAWRKIAARLRQLDSLARRVIASASK